MDLLIVLAPIIVTSLGTAWLASRFALRRGRKPGWTVVLGSSIASCALVLVFGYLGVLSVPGDIPKIGGIRYWTRVAPVLLAVSGVIALILSAAVADLYRRKTAAKGRKG